MRNRILRYTFGLIILIIFIVLLPIKPQKNENSILGVTFSPRAAEHLNYNWRDLYQRMLEDLSPDIIRIPVYWNVLEEEKDTYNWEFVDYQLDLLKDTDTKVILAVGHKLPRWPECHIPEWAKDLSEAQIEKEIFDMVGDTVNRYKDNPNLESWQVQNEVLFKFGDCPEWSGSRNRLKRLISLVQTLDPNHRVGTSDSGELSLWLRTSTLPIDTLSVSLYRVAYNPRHDYFRWPVNPYYYKLHAMLVKPFVGELIISELQMEPWGPSPVDKLHETEIPKSFAVEEFAERIDFAQRTGASTILTWGVEWWYYMNDMRNDPRYLDEAIKIFNPTPNP